MERVCYAAAVFPHMTSVSGSLNADALQPSGMMHVVVEMRAFSQSARDSEERVSIHSKQLRIRVSYEQTRCFRLSRIAFSCLSLTFVEKHFILNTTTKQKIS